MKKYIYLDNAATTKTKNEVWKAMKEYFEKEYANPNANYAFAREPQKAIEKSRQQLADLIGAKKEEIYFTSGGSESDNWAIKSIAENYVNKGKHIITSAIEHHAVLNTMKWLEKNGFEVTYLKPHSNGIIDISELEKCIRKDTILISVMFANNEVGTIQPIKEIGNIARKNKIIFHTDAVQAVGHVPIDVQKMKIDLLSASGHKFHGPKGVGFLFSKKGINLSPLIHGGSQEDGLRAGTYNVPGIVGMGEAARLINITEGIDKISILRDLFIKRVITEIPNVYLNGDEKKRLPNNINIRIEKMDSEAILMMLSEAGIYASAGSACTSGDVNPSHVLLALGLNKEQARSSIRFTLSEETTIEEIDYTIEKLKNIISLISY